MTNTAFEDWTEAYRRLTASGTELSWPSETLVRLLKGRYVPGWPTELRGRKVLDVGTGNGNNVPLFASVGMSCHGTEVTDALCVMTRERLQRLGVAIEMRAGTNQSLGYEDETFDLVVSWNVLHYESTEDGILAALAEYRRVLRPGGRLLVSTTGPEHKLLQGADALPGHRRQIRRADDFRAGQVFYAFEDPAHIERCFGGSFREVLVGRTLDRLFTETLDWFIITAVRS